MSRSWDEPMQSCPVPQGRADWAGEPANHGYKLRITSDSREKKIAGRAESERAGLAGYSFPGVGT